MLQRVEGKAEKPCYGLIHSFIYKDNLMSFQISVEEKYMHTLLYHCFYLPNDMRTIIPYAKKKVFVKNSKKGVYNVASIYCFMYCFGELLIKKMLMSRVADPVFKFSGSGSGSGFSQDSGKLQKGL